MNGMENTTTSKMRRRLTLAATCMLMLGEVALAYDYQVEAIVFRHTTPQAAEAWSTAGAVPDFAAARRLGEPATERASDPLHEYAPFTRLPATELRLSGAAKLLAGSAAHEVVSHQAWRQPGDAGIAVHLGDERLAGDGAATRPAALEAEVGAGASGPDPGTPAPPLRPRAEGTLRLQVAVPDMRVLSDFVVMAGDTPVRVKATRNLKSGELHYLDHELLGILLQVTSLAPAPLAPSPAPDAGQSGDEDLSD